MAKKSVTKEEYADLAKRGFVEGNKNTIPENISPVLKSKLLKDMGEDGSGSTPGEAGGPEALAQREQRRERIVKDRDPLDHDGDGRKGGVKQ
jgi:hypothetical protein